MPRMQKRPYVEPIRRKCFNCGSVKQVEHKQWFPVANTTQTNYTPNMEKKVLRKDQPGMQVRYYCSTECGGDVFINHYTEEDFIRP
jgi:hypothetical protein